jgi:adenosylcobinamide-phosphate synthase
VLALEIAAAYLLDCVVGDPRWFPHPVRGMGWLVKKAERHLRPSLTRPAQVVAGGLVSLVVIGLSYGLTLAASLWAVRDGDPAVGFAANTVLLWLVMSTRDLADHANRVLASLRRGDLEGARLEVSHIVGRDTACLDEPGVSRAAVEAVAESLSDGVVAPLFYAALGGPALAMAYKAVNTLDSMIGHKDSTYLYFGRVAARLDDVANYVPARVTAFLLALAGSTTPAEGRRALATMFRDGSRHPSPNSGYPEAAMAGLLDVRLGGVNHYRGVPSERPGIRLEGAVARAGDVSRAVRAMRRASLAAVLLAIITRSL